MTVDQEAKNLLLREEVIAYYNNDQMSAQYYKIDDKYDGEYKQWHENGQLWVYCFYKNGEKDGKFKRWFENGQLFQYCFYKDGVLIKDYFHDNRPTS